MNKKTPSVVKMEMIGKPKFSFMDWVCGTCEEENISRVQMLSTVHQDTCVECGSKFNIYLDWDDSLIGSKIK